jgi:hypothetical protein
MAFRKGEKRHPNAGRKAGTPNKNTQTLIDKAKELGVDPFDVVLRFAKGDWKGLGYDAEKETKFTAAGIEYEEYLIKPEMRLKAASEACQYILPKRKAIEQSIDPATAEMLERLEKLTDKELVDIVTNSVTNKDK